jgi:hypothetical protein
MEMNDRIPKGMGEFVDFLLDARVGALASR